ncbi:MAG: type 4a pilus biogenesis protein PilO [Candidatus Omnitrophica bacterium]|nr:type 4a pilus biogenesis protein PilO [Candidatus Omnitrophota bacterium]MCK5260082.1 type 4a pilus biogenesis protein PilO [Candidatus Omnitrophota bacterium]
MNLKDLNSINVKDLQNIDWDRVKDRIQSQPDLLINILLVIVTFAVLFSTFNTYTKTAKTSKAETIALQKRLVALKKFEAAKKEHSDFLKEIPKAIASDQLIQTLSELAIQRDIQILSFSPAKKRSNALVNLTSVVVNVASKDYASIILFVHDIEESSYPVRVESWSGSSLKPGETPRRRSQRSSRRTANETIDTKEDYIKATITIASVELKNV